MQVHGCDEVPGHFGTDGNGFGSADLIPLANPLLGLGATGACGIQGPELLDSLVVESLLEEADVMQYDPINCKLAEGEIAPRTISDWVKVADTPVNAGSRMAVRDAAFLIVHELRISTTTFQAVERFCRVFANTDLVPGENGPYNEKRMPPSLAICRRVLDVPGLDRYVIHVCSNGC
jgi:hypothetical protein